MNFYYLLRYQKMLDTMQILQEENVRLRQENSYLRAAAGPIVDGLDYDIDGEPLCPHCGIKISYCGESATDGDVISSHIVEDSMDCVMSKTLIALGRNLV